MCKSIGVFESLTRIKSQLLGLGIGLLKDEIIAIIFKLIKDYRPIIAVKEE
jgi:hypothetical protein